MRNFNKSKLKWWVYSLMLIFVLASCSLKDRVPGHIPSKKKMTDILVDLHLTENVLNVQNVSSNKSSLGYYNDVLKRHGITSVEFDSAMAWYSAHPVVYMKVYDQVIEILTEKEANLQQVITLTEKVKNDSLLVIKNLWKDSTFFNLPLSDTIDNRLAFHIPIDSLSKGTVKLSAWYTYKKDDLVKRDEMMLVTCYADSTRDTLRTVITKSYSRVNASISSVLKVDTSAVALEGYLLYHKQGFPRHLDVEDIMLEFIPTPTIKK